MGNVRLCTHRTRREPRELFSRVFAWLSRAGLVGVLLPGSLVSAAPLAPLPPPTAADTKACSKPGKTSDEVKVCTSPQVWAKAAIGAVQTGIDEKSRPTGRIFYVLVVGPGFGTIPKRAVAEELERSLQDITGNKVATVLQRQLDRIQTVDSSLEEAARKDQNIDVQKTLVQLNQEMAAHVLSAMQGASINYQSATRKLFRDFGVDAARFRVAVSESACIPSEGCALPAWGVDDKNFRFNRYSKLAVWQRESKYGVGQLIGFDYKDVQTAFAFGPMQEVRKVPTSEVTAATQLKQFERFVNAVRRDSIKYPDGFNLSSAVPSLLGLSKRSALAIVDILESPVTTISQLPAAEGSGVLESVSDELARTRITECAQLRGEVTHEAIGKCAGYQLTGSQDVADCIGGKRCFPAMGKEMKLDALLIADPKNTRALVTSVALPRIKLASDLKQLEARVNECASEGRNKSEADMAVCLAGKQDKKSAATFDCARQASSLNGASQRAKISECLLANANLKPEQLRQVACLQEKSQSVTDLILCTSKDKLSPEAKALAECIQQQQDTPRTRLNLQTCLLSKVPGAAGKVLACLQQPGDWKVALACSMKDQVGGDVGRALECASKNNGNAAGTAVCMVRVGGDLGKAAECLAQSGGNWVGAAVCAAGANDGLTVDQRIALQCAAQSGGVPVTFAACLVGQMTLKELGYCKGNKFGEGKCFNENNEFRKFFKQMGIEIGPKSVVADVINVHLKYFEAQLAFGSDVNEKVKEELTKAEKVLRESFNAVAKAHEEVMRAPLNVHKSACTRVAKLLFGKKKRC